MNLPTRSRNLCGQGFRNCRHGRGAKGEEKAFFAKPELEYGRFYATKPVGLGADGLKKRSHWKYDPNFWAARAVIGRECAHASAPPFTAGVLKDATPQEDGAPSLKIRTQWAARGTLRAWLEELQILSFQTAVGRRFEHLAARKNRRLSRKGSVRRGEARTQRWEAKAASSLCCS